MEKKGKTKTKVIDFLKKSTHQHINNEILKVYNIFLVSENDDVFKAMLDK